MPKCTANVYKKGPLYIFIVTRKDPVMTCTLSKQNIVTYFNRSDLLYFGIAFSESGAYKKIMNRFNI